MKRYHPLIALLGLVLSVTSIQASDLQPGVDLALLNDADWQRRFLGSYGFLSDVEPEIRPSELEVLREVIDLMKANPRAAAAMLEQQIGADTSAALDFVLGNLYFQNGDQTQAILHYKDALHKFPDFRRAHKNLGLLRIQMGDYRGGLENLGRAVELGDRDGRSFGLIGYCYINLENYVAADAAYRNAIMQEPDVRDWTLGLARAQLAMEHYKDAAALFGALIDKNPMDVSSWMLQANAFLGMEKPLDAAVNLETVRILGEAQAQSLVLLGDIYMNEGMMELAKSAYLSAIALDDAATEFKTAYRAADLLVRSRAFADAQEIVASIDERYAKDLTQDEELELLTLKAKLARAQGREKEAAQLLTSIIERDGTRGDALLELAAYYHAQGDNARAVLLVERAARIEAYEYQALLDNAQYVISEKDYEQAALLLRKALEIRHEPRVERFLARVELAVSR